MSNLDKRIADLPQSIYTTVSQIDNPAKRQPIQIMTHRDEREARAYCEILDHVFAHYQDMKISVETIRYLHDQLFKYSDKAQSHRGKYRWGENKVETRDRNGKTLRVLVEGIPLNQMQQALDDLINWLHEVDEANAYHPLVVISAFIVEFLKIHPFVDGNGRVSRILTNLLLLQAGYDAERYFPHEKLIEDDTEKYYLALSHSQKTFGTESESIRIWTEYFLGLLLQQTARAATIRTAETSEPLADT